ncbi:MAG: STAS domain-containing protein [Treponemataceae bacterium]|nr:STAS domain-containing protein [Treponemataceae bacterium]
MAESLLYTEEQGVLYLKAVGHITAALCADLREIVFSRLDSAPPVQDLYIDLSQCTYMDSTFMGLLVGFNKRLLRSAKHPITIVHPSDEARNLLAALGIVSLVKFVETAVEFPKNMIDIIQTKKAELELLLHAHENLMEISEENRKKFATLHGVLKSQMKDPSKEK